VQPVVFQPVLGLPDSRLKAGEAIETSCYVLVQPGTWTDALEYASHTIFRVTDYRRPWGVSLSGAALNLFDLLNDDVAGGFDPRLKGFYQIESRATVTQCAPLAVLEAAILSRDEALYARRALPGIEFSLSRPSAHFAVDEPTSAPRYVSEANTRLGVPSKFFGTAYWQGLHEMLGRANPWIAELALQPSGAVRWNHSYSAVPKWSELLAAYRLTPTPALLQQVQREADKFVTKEFNPRRSGDLDLLGFCNVHAYPYWWDLLDLYEITHDRKYLAAAEQGGFHTLASLWSCPPPPGANDMVRVHPGGRFNDHPLMWWRNESKFRLGWPRKAGDLPEQVVPGWLVSNVGLGIEQLTTYYDRVGDRGMQNIFMSCWAPHLLRLYQYTGRDIFQTYARNGIIGRFGSYPGYYLSGFTTACLDAGYPRKGPDVTDIYYHHIPAHLAFTLDFIVAEASERSHDAIAFPWVKQQGYVWFSNRIYGSGPGRIFDDRGVELRLQRQGVQIASPDVTHLMGRSRARWWLILMNESHEALTPEVRLDAASLRLDVAQPYESFAADGTSLGRKAVSATVSPRIPARGLVALSFAAAPDPAVGRQFPPVAAGHVVQNLPAPFEQMHAFRIRSPFGKDSLYVVLTGKPRSAVAAIELDGAAAAPREVRQHPYEFSVYPWPMDRDMTFRLKLTDAAGKTQTTAPVTLPGGR